ncbi:MAG: transcriptional repressor LexA [Vulcanimicrobiota bacterium]
MKKLTDRQQEILDFIVEEIQRQGYPPTLREISSRFGISSTQGVRRHIDALEKKGYIVRDAGARRISVSSEILDLSHSTEVVSVPVLGEVAAGQPIFADEQVEDRIPVSTDWVGPRGEHFFLKVKGYSMADSILPGDMVLVVRQQVANNGEIVVALLEDEATVKRFYKKGSEIRLKSDNPEFDDIIPDGHLQILGRVTALMRRY